VALENGDMDMKKERLTVERQCYSINETAQLLGLSVQGTYQACWKGEIPSIKIGKSRLIPKVQLDALLAGK
jgi:excisionase family DNA binding protein